MGKATLEVFITASAREDLDAIWRYWADRDEPERGEKYATDLHAEAVSELSNPQVAKGGKYSVMVNLLFVKFASSAAFIEFPTAWMKF